MLPRDLLDTARHLVASGKGKPRQAHLRRAVSTTYYALFHTLAKTCADLVAGKATHSKPAWNQVYRALQHGFAKDACKHADILSKFPNEIQDFANMFVAMQDKRHKADYDPDEKVFKSAVEADIRAVESVMDGFEKAPIRDRRAFVALVLLKRPPKG